MRKFRIGALWLVVAAVFFACLEQIDISGHPADYQFHQTSLHAKVHWSYRFLDDKNLVVEGLVEAWSGDVKLEDVLLTAILYDSAGREILKQSKRPRMAILNPGQLSPFRIQVEFPTKPAKVRIEESYKPIRSY